MPTLMGNLSTTARISGSFRAAELEGTGLTGTQYVYILRICHSPGITGEELSRSICIHKSNVARQVEKLEQNGFLTRRQDGEDRRVWRLYPTERAMEVLPVVRETVRKWNAYLTADFTDEELETLLSLMERVRARAVGYFETGSLGSLEGDGGERHEETV